MTARISMAGGLTVSVDGRPTDASPLPGGQPRVVFGLLVCERNRCIGNEELAHNLWPDHRPATWKTALRGVVSKVRDFLVEAGLGDRRVVQAEAGAYRLRLPPCVEIDVERALEDTDAAREALDAGDLPRAVEAADHARVVLRRPLLPGLRAPWTEVWRRRLSRRLVDCLELLATARLAMDDTGAEADAIAAAEEITHLDPYRESGYRLAIRAHLGTGNRAAASRAYERCRTLLVEDLGIEPSPETQALHARLAGVGRPVGDHGPRA
jgi:DNA-binding SARP family transcriptional activator